MAGSISFFKTFLKTFFSAHGGLSQLPMGEVVMKIRKEIRNHCTLMFTCSCTDRIDIPLSIYLDNRYIFGEKKGGTTHVDYRKKCVS